MKTSELTLTLPVAVRYTDRDSIADPATLLATVDFSLEPPQEGGELVVHVPLRQLGEVPKLERWTASQSIERGQHGNIRFATTRDVLFGTISFDSTDLEDPAYHAYEEVVHFVRSSGFSNLLRMWNHLRDINCDINGLEQYRRFSRARHDAFARLGYTFTTDLPAASAVGLHTGGFVLYFLAARSGGTQLENPRQISAFHYPAEYGPRSPSFSRATVKEWPDGAQLFVSGTASIVGHESRHIDDLAKQLDETLINIDALLKVGSSHVGRTATLGDLTSLKVYVRNPDDYEALRDLLARAISPSTTVLYVEADICRQELLLEIEGVAEF